MTACAQLAAATCAKIEACVKGGVVHRYGDAATCEARQTAACVVSLGANATGNMPETVTTCATTLPQSTCAEYEAAEVAVCAPQAGTRAAGATCTYSAQCATSFCAIALGTNCGVCAAATAEIGYLSG